MASSDTSALLALVCGSQRAQASERRASERASGEAESGQASGERVSERASGETGTRMSVCAVCCTGDWRASGREGGGGAAAHHHGYTNVGLFVRDESVSSSVSANL